MPNVKSARSRIDEIDGKIVELLSQRLSLARDVGAFKAAEARKAGKKKPTILVPEREEEIFRRLKKIANERGLPWGVVQGIFSDIISLCRAGQGTITAHVLGPAGTHSEAAARARFGDGARLVHHDSIPAAIKAAESAVAQGDSDSVAVVPLENSLEGTVVATIDALQGTSLQLVGEGYYRVRHALLSRAKDLGSIKQVQSHPMGLAQCKQWLQEHLPHARLVEAKSTAEAARIAAASPAAKGVAAIASSITASAELKVLVGDVQDSSDNVTRFGVLGEASPKPTGDDRTALVFSLPNKPGALVGALEVFERHKLNMTRIESRPYRGLAWEYLFYVDVDGHAADPKLSKALEAFDRKVRYFKVLGTYPKGRKWN